MTEFDSISASMKLSTCPDISYPIVAQLLSAPSVTIVRVRIYGETTVYSLPRCAYYNHMLSTIRRALRGVLQGNPDIHLLNSADHVVLTKASWPFIVNSLYEIVVRVSRPQPILGDVIDLTQDVEDETPVQPRHGGEVRPPRAPPSTSFDVDVDGVADEEGQHYQPVRHTVRVRGASILPHVRKKTNATRRSMSRSVPSVVLSNQPVGFPKLHQHLELERDHKAMNHWVVPPKSKHRAVRAWLDNPARFKRTLPSEDRQWLGRNNVRGKGERKLIDDGPELYNLLVRAHGKNHLKSERTFERIRQRYVGPPRGFVERWVALCPTCRRKSRKHRERSYDS
ncbi:unnamed protein product [Peniophora sp. CBMAI 1063]|nr:unnamed protein product [Peniophora sp. CBMAI 1063]